MSQIYLRSCGSNYYYCFDSTYSYPNNKFYPCENNDENHHHYYPCDSSCIGCSGNTGCTYCINGLYKIYGDTDNVCHSGDTDYYYVDRSANVLKSCHNDCLRCYSGSSDSEHMNCISCRNSGHYLTEDTRSCFASKQGYYKDNANKMLRRCHPRCASCSAGPTPNSMNCDSCANGYYNKQEENSYPHSCYSGKIPNYYLDYSAGMYKKCNDNNCLECDQAGICTFCKENFYLKDVDQSCISNYNKFYYDFGSKTLKSCYSNCLSCYSSPTDSNHMNCITCLNSGYHKSEDTNSCYITVIDKYYLDTNANILRRCHPNCKKCNGPPINETYMNCQECIDNYYMLSDTKSCYKDEIDNYYKISSPSLELKKCHQNCLRCNTNQNNHCKICQNGYYMTSDLESCHEDIINHYYYNFTTKKLENCYNDCLRCYSSGINSTYMNCISCSNSNHHLTEDTRSYYNSRDNYYLDSNTNILRRCHPNCKSCSGPPTNDTLMNCLTCIENYYITNDTDSCYKGKIDNYYLDYEDNPWKYKRCHPNCLTCNTSQINNTHMNCLTCQNNYYITEDTNSCFDEIIDNYYFDFGNRTLRRCHLDCLRCTWAPINDTLMNCISCRDNYYLTEDTNSCYNYVLDNYYKDNITLRRCYPNCYLCYGAPESDYLQNCETCKPNYYMTEDRNSCYTAPAALFYNF